MSAPKLRSFISAFIIQKMGEYFLLSACLAVQLYVGTRLPDPTEWEVFGGPNIDVFTAIVASVTGAGIFFLFTLYPVVTFVFVALGRKLLGVGGRRLLPWLSAAVSVGYVALWVCVTQYNAKVVPFWIITLVVGVFIVISSALLYPPVQSPTKHERA
jgi:hypothetical protein